MQVSLVELCQVTVGVLLSVLSLKVLLLNQDVNALLYHRDFGLEPEATVVESMLEVKSSRTLEPTG